MFLKLTIVGVLVFCSGICSICNNRCYIGEIKVNQEKISPISPEEEEGASKAFDSAVSDENVVTLQKSDVQTEETGLSVVENIGSYEVKRNIFGKEVVRKIK